MFRIPPLLVVLFLGGLFAEHPSVAAPLPKGPSAEQEETLLALDEVQLSITDFAASLITADRERVADEKKFCEGLQRRAKSLNALVKVIARGNAQAKGEEDLQKLINASLAKAQQSLDSVESSLKDATGKEGWEEKVQSAGRNVLAARPFDDLNKRRGKAVPEIIEKREE